MDEIKSNEKLKSQNPCPLPDDECASVKTDEQLKQDSQEDESNLNEDEIQPGRIIPMELDFFNKSNYVVLSRCSTCKSIALNPYACIFCGTPIPPRAKIKVQARDDEYFEVCGYSNITMSHFSIKKAIISIEELTSKRPYPLPSEESVSVKTDEQLMKDYVEHKRRKLKEDENQSGRVIAKELDFFNKSNYVVVNRCSACNSITYNPYACLFCGTPIPPYTKITVQAPDESFLQIYGYNNITMSHFSIKEAIISKAKWRRKSHFRWPDPLPDGKCASVKTDEQMKQDCVEAKSNLNKDENQSGRKIPELDSIIAVAPDEEVRIIWH